MKKVFYRVDNKKIYKEYVFYVVSFFCSIAASIFTIYLRTNVCTKNCEIINIAIILTVLIMLLLICKIFTIIANHMDFNAYVIDKSNGDFYKVGIYPRNWKLLPSEDEFLLDTHYLCNLLSEKGNLKLKVKALLFNRLDSRYETGGINLLGVMLDLYNEDYLLEFLNEPKHIITYKVLKVHSFYEDELRYTIMCDVLRSDGKTRQNIRMNIKKIYDKNDELKVQLKKLC